MNKPECWASEAREIARAFRLGSYMQAGDPLAELLRQVAEEPASRQAELVAILDAILACHKRDDWLGVADYLQFELVDWLGCLGPAAAP